MTEVAGLGHVKVIAISDVKPAERNPRRIPPAAVDIVAKSLQRFGWQQPLVVDGENVLVAGHTRLQAARKLGLKEVPVIVAENLSPAELDAYRIADNRTHDFTSWDFPQLVAQLDELSSDFSDVLALTDWQAVVTEFEEAQAEFDLPPDAKADMSGRGFSLVVVFQDEESALRQEQMLIELPGVLDVRHKQ